MGEILIVFYLYQPVPWTRTKYTTIAMLHSYGFLVANICVLYLAFGSCDVR